MTENIQQADIVVETTKPAHTLIGRVISDKRDKTVTLRVDRRIKHPLYGKEVMRSDKYQAHDENNVCQVGDLVEIQPSRKISKTKSWTVSRIVEKAAG